MPSGNGEGCGPAERGVATKRRSRGNRRKSRLGSKRSGVQSGSRHARYATVSANKQPQNSVVRKICEHNLWGAEVKTACRGVRRQMEHSGPRPCLHGKGEFSFPFGFSMHGAGRFARSASYSRGPGQGQIRGTQDFASHPENSAAPMSSAASARVCRTASSSGA